MYTVVKEGKKWGVALHGKIVVHELTLPAARGYAELFNREVIKRKE